jgi:hypothetical protein
MISPLLPILIARFPARLLFLKIEMVIFAEMLGNFFLMHGESALNEFNIA